MAMYPQRFPVPSTPTRKVFCEACGWTGRRKVQQGKMDAVVTAQNCRKCGGEVYLA